MSTFDKLLAARDEWRGYNFDIPTVVKMNPRTKTKLREYTTQATHVLGMKIVEVYPLADDVFQFEGADE